MNRRQLLKVLPAIVASPLIINGSEVGKICEIKPDGKYVVFIKDSERLEVIESLQYSNFPEGTVIHVLSDLDSIKIYKIDE